MTSKILTSKISKEERKRKKEERGLKGVVNLRINLRVFEAFQRDCA